MMNCIILTFSCIFLFSRYLQRVICYRGGRNLSVIQSIERSFTSTSRIVQELIFYDEVTECIWFFLHSGDSTNYKKERVIKKVTNIFLTCSINTSSTSQQKHGSAYTCTKDCIYSDSEIQDICKINLEKALKFQLYAHFYSHGSAAYIINKKGISTSCTEKLLFQM